MSSNADDSRRTHPDETTRTRLVDPQVPPQSSATGPWGMCSGAEWSHEHPRFTPILAEAGVTSLRMFREWQNIQPEPDAWRWDEADAIVSSARRNAVELLGLWCYFATWASADGGTRQGPIKDIDAWRRYVGATVTRYGRSIPHWEVWNEFNGSFYSGPDKPRAYARLTVAAFDAARRADPDVAVGMSVASSDIGFLDLAIEAGAHAHFDFLAIHPYENTAALMYGDEVGFLGLADTLRQMLARNGQPTDTPLWITEVGVQAPVDPDPEADARQAEGLLKVYVLALAQGFERVYWFEARGPAYGKGTDHGIIRKDWTLRPAYHAMSAMIDMLGQAPVYVGWLALGEKQDAFGFVFEQDDRHILAAWAPRGVEREVSFTHPVRAVDHAGRSHKVDAGHKIALAPMPVFIADLPDKRIEQAKANAAHPFPWGGNYSHADEVAILLGDRNREDGLTQIFLREDHENCTEPAGVDGEPARRVVSRDRDHVFAYFRTHPSFLEFAPQTLELTVVARRSDPRTPAGIAVTYETREGYRDFKTGGETWAVPGEDAWHEHTFRLDNACFANRWGWHLGLITPDDEPALLIRELRVRRGT